MRQSYQCPNCHSPVAFGVRFCGNCGTQLSWPTEQQASQKQKQELAGSQKQQAGYSHHIETKRKRTSLWLIGSIIFVLLSGVIIFATGIPFHNTPPATISPTPSSGAGDYATANIEDESETLEITLADGTAIIAPPGSLSEGTTISIRKIDIEEAPPLPDGFNGVESLYDFGVDQPLHGAVILHIAIPIITDDSILVLSHYHEGLWEPVPFTPGEQVVIVETNDLSIWGWLDMSVARFAEWADEKIMKYADTGRYIDWYEEATGISALTELSLENSSSHISYNDSEAKGLISASAVTIDGDKVRLRVRNNTKFYLQLYFEGTTSIEPLRGSYIIDFADPISKALREFLPQEALLMLPEGTAEFTIYKPGETLKVKAVFSDLAAFYSTLDPVFSLVPIVDLETFVAVRDVLGEGSRYVRSISALEKSFSEYAYDLLDLVELTSHSGVLLGEKAFKKLANMLVIPRAVEIRKKYLEGRGADIAKNARDARIGVSLTFEFLTVDEPASEAELEPETIPSSGRGNSVGNIVNLGLVAQQGGWIYYLSNDGGKIYKVRTDGSERTKLNDESSSYINVMDGWIYYTKGYEFGGRIYKMRTDGSERTKLNDESSSYINVVDGWIYYAVGDLGGIYRMRIDGTERTQLTKEFSNYINVVDGWVYYKGSGGKIYRMRTNGSERTKVHDDAANYINVVDGWIYYGKISPYTWLYKMRIDGSERTQLNDKHSRRINVVNDWVYYSNFSDNSRLYKMRIDGSGCTKLNDERSYYINIVDGWIYYQGSDGIYRIRIDGSGCQLVD